MILDLFLIYLMDEMGMLGIEKFKIFYKWYDGEFCNKVRVLAG